MHLHLFDIDGTLTRFFHSEYNVYDQMLRSILTLPPDYNYANEVAHFTDSHVLDHTYQRFVKRLPTAEETEKAKLRYIELLDACCDTHAHIFKPIPGADAYLHHLQSQPKTVVAVATGNWKNIALYKLDKMGADAEKMSVMGADHHHAKADFVAALLEEIKEQHKIDRFTSACYYGDSPYDLAAAKSNGLSFVGIDYKSRGRLQEAGAKMIYKDFDAFLTDQATLR